jgi:hypothetical protein
MGGGGRGETNLNEGVVTRHIESAGCVARSVSVAAKESAKRVPLCTRLRMECRIWKRGGHSLQFRRKHSEHAPKFLTSSKTP